MARTITTAVGRMGARNLPGDVATVQDLLNLVPPGAGRPQQLLVVDSLCGPKTITAIQKFQIHHFGWSGADGRVDPDGQTLRKLNEFDRPRPVPPHARPFTPRTVARCPHLGVVVGYPAQPRAEPATLMVSDRFRVVGCSFRVGRTASPCVTVRWVQPPAGALTHGSIGLCLNAKGEPQGTVTIIS